MSQEKYVLSLIDQVFQIEVPRIVFDCKSFVHPHSAASSRELRKQNQAWLPMTPWHADVFQLTDESLDQFFKVFDNGKLHLKTSAGRVVSVAEIRRNAKSFSDLSLTQRFEKAARELGLNSYSGQIEQAKIELLERFKRAFDSIHPLHPMELDAEESLRMEDFTHNAVWAEAEVLGELKNLADQGHAYSQYLTGVLLGTVAGGFSTDCIEYIVAAYKQKVPEAMAVLAEFCFTHRDYYGALQCALLSVDGGYDDSRRLIKKCFQNLNILVYETQNGIAFGSQLIPAALREAGYASIMHRVLSEAA